MKIFRSHYIIEKTVAAYYIVPVLEEKFFVNLKEIEYIVKIAEENNISRAAEKLFITPSALSQQLQNVEKDIGTPLFFRSRSNCIPTEAGYIFLETAKMMQQMKKETYHQIQDLVDIKKGILRVGFPPERGTAMFTQVYPDFPQKYPDITINVTETNVRTQQKLIAKGELDIGFVTLKESQQTADTYLPICNEELILVIPSDHPACLKARPSDTSCYPELDIEEIRDEPFALMYKESTIYEIINQIFRQAGFIPNVLFETTRACTIMDIVAAGMCCSIIPDADYIPCVKGVSLFSMPSHPTWSIKALYRKGSYLGKPAKEFISLASQYWQNQVQKFSPV